MADNVHWLRGTYGPALRAFYGDLLNQPVPQRFVDLMARLEAEAEVATASDVAAGPPDAHQSTAVAQCEPQPDTSE